MRLPDPATSRVILIGTAAYEDPDIADLPAVSANVTDLARVLTDPDLGGLDDAACHRFVDPRSDDVWRIAELAAQAEDVLVVYFAGHGLLGDDGTLLLGMANTKLSYPEFTALHVDQLVRAIETSQAKTRLFVLDCCYSERALRHMGTPAQQLVIEGTYTLASAPANRSAVAPEGERHTAFTGELISLLRSGDPAEEELLSVAAVFRKLVPALRSKGYPTPKQSNSGTASALALVRNAAYRPARLAAPPPALPSAVDLRRAVLRATSPVAERLAALDTLVRRAKADEDCVEELELLAVSGYVPLVLRLGCVYALDALREESRAKTAAATIVAGTSATVDLVRFLLGSLVHTGDGVALSELGRHSHPLWGRQVSDVLSGIGIPVSERIRAAADLAGLGCHAAALTLLRALSDRPDIAEDAREQIRAAIRETEADATAELRFSFKPAPPNRWGIQPLLGEPPLTLFRGKHLKTLKPGLTIDRYGQPTGNLTYHAGTPFERRSLVPEWIEYPYHAYEVREPLRALVGTAVPWFDQPGGGTAYVLPHSIADLLERGLIAEVPAQAPGRYRAG
ncbi:TNT domain-containing protein [Actinokineospora spheciospongiae]|uniref:TNT domain-containing protein n=1 Tax=Actinokineospora spheciospongiae TaxID=909613 RepID=UPI000D716953|nr:TNT domain-containing protein [Actinokineospora spheciospongiae]PWW56851.1 caspase domain-containing protein [Actinokineospora spheciospongiae]